LLVSSPKGFAKTRNGASMPESQFTKEVVAGDPFLPAFVFFFSFILFQAYFVDM